MCHELCHIRSYSEPLVVAAALRPAAPLEVIVPAGLQSFRRRTHLWDVSTSGLCFRCCHARRKRFKHLSPKLLMVVMVILVVAVKRRRKRRQACAETFKLWSLPHAIGSFSASSKRRKELLVSYQGDQIYTFDISSHPTDLTDPSQWPGTRTPCRTRPSCRVGGHLNHDTFLKSVAFFGPRVGAC